MKDLRLNKRFGAQFAYLFDCIYSDEFNVEQMNDREKIEYVFEQFNAEHGGKYYEKLFPNEQSRLADWLQGLPTSCNISYTYYDIIEIGKSWGFCQTERKEADFVNNWFNTMAFRLIQMRNALCK